MLGRRDQVVAGDTVLDRPRRRALPTSAPSDTASSIPPEQQTSRRLDSVGLVHLLRHAGPHPLRLSPAGSSTGGASTVVRSSSSRPRSPVRNAQSQNISQTGPTWSARGEHDDAVTRTIPVVGLEPDVAAERARLLDRPAGVGASASSARPPLTAAFSRRRAARDTRRVPRVVCRPVREFSVDEPIASSSEYVLRAAAALLAARGDRESVDRRVILLDLRPTIIGTPFVPITSLIADQDAIAGLASHTCR